VTASSGELRDAESRAVGGQESREASRVAGLGPSPEPRGHPLLRGEPAGLGSGDGHSPEAGSAVSPVRGSEPLAARRPSTAFAGPRLAAVPALVLLLGAPVAAARAQPLFAAARATAERGRLDSAYLLIRRAAAAEPDSAPIQFWLGEIAAFKARSAGFGLAGFVAARRSEAGFARAVALAPDDPDYLQGFAEFLAQAPGIVGGNRDSARALGERLRHVDPVRGTLVLADVLRRGHARDRARADSLVAELVETFPADRVALGGAGNYYAVTGRPALGVPLYARLVARDSSDGPARYGLARLLVREGREPRRAQVQVRWVLAHLRSIVVAAASPGAPGRRFWFSPAGAWVMLGETYRQLAMSDSARLCFTRALALVPRYRPALRALDSLR
jgi:tetratricopeptide (TPR) repeat protein